MAKIQNVKCDVAGGVGPCGPGPSIAVCEVELLTEQGETKFLTLVEVEGSFNFFENVESVFEKHMDFDTPDEFFMDQNENHMLGGFCDYFELFENEISKQNEIRYLLYVCDSDWDEMKKYIESTKGKDINEIEIPKSGSEIQWEEDKEEE